MENEHLNNCGQFRATRSISIKPLYNVNDEDIEDDYDDENIDNCNDDEDDIKLSSLSSQRIKLRKRRSEGYKSEVTHVEKFMHDISENDDNFIKETSVQSADLSDCNDSLIASMTWIESVLSNHQINESPANESVSKISRLHDQSHRLSNTQCDESNSRKASKASQDSIRNIFSVISDIRHDEYLSTPIKESNV